MRIKFLDIHNFRKLKSCRIDLSDKQTVLVGANNSGKTSSMDALTFFLTDKKKFCTRDFTLNNWLRINELAEKWLTDDKKDEDYWNVQLDKLQELLPQLDLWLGVRDTEIHYVHHLIPTLDWEGGLLGIRLRFEPHSLETLFKEYKSHFDAAKKLGANSPNIKLWPKSLWDFLDHKQKLSSLFTVKSYILDPSNVKSSENNVQFQLLSHNNFPLERDVLRGLIKVDTINAQRGFSDANTNNGKLKSLSSQFKEYYAKHLNPEEKPTADDLEVLNSIDKAKQSFDDRLKKSFGPSLTELRELNYPGFGNPNIRISSSISPLDGLNHDSAVQYDVINNNNHNEKLTLPEQSNGLGYQNLISMVFELIRFRDEWMKVGKSSIEKDEDIIFEPIHLVLIEEPEAHLHAQIQQVFIRKAYEVLREHENLKQNEQFRTQLIISTHSNHIAHEVEFTSLRYFKRILEDKNNVATSKVVNLSKTFGDNEDETTRFAIRYLKTTHCDLFFADAIILIEGSSERILVPHFIKQHHPRLATSYLSLIEIGGSHAHRLKSLVEDLGILTLIITDLDSIDPKNKRKHVLPSQGKEYETGNSTISKWVPVKTKIDDLLDLKPESKISSTGQIRIAFQIKQNVNIDDNSNSVYVHPTSFEDSLVFENIQLFKELSGNGLISKFKTAITSATNKSIENHIYEALRKCNSGEKAKFALDILLQIDPKDLNIPNYIDEGLTWLENKLNNENQL
jgi:predicted ATP-dependent endonuclease of OLD family